MSLAGVIIVMMEDKTLVDEIATEVARSVLENLDAGRNTLAESVKGALQKKDFPNPTVVTDDFYNKEVPTPAGSVAFHAKGEGGELIACIIPLGSDHLIYGNLHMLIGGPDCGTYWIVTDGEDIIDKERCVLKKPPHKVKYLEIHTYSAGKQEKVVHQNKARLLHFTASLLEKGSDITIMIYNPAGYAPICRMIREMSRKRKERKGDRDYVLRGHYELHTQKPKESLQLPTVNTLRAGMVNKEYLRSTIISTGEDVSDILEPQEAEERQRDERMEGLPLCKIDGYCGYGQSIGHRGSYEAILSLFVPPLQALTDYGREIVVDLAKLDRETLRLYNLTRYMLEGFNRLIQRDEYQEIGEEAKKFVERYKKDIRRAFGLYLNVFRMDEYGKFMEENKGLREGIKHYVDTVEEVIQRCLST
jgi:hypothetical protein